MEWIRNLYENKMVAFGVIGAVGGYITGKSKKARMRNAYIGAAAGAGAGYFMDQREEAGLEGFYGAPAQITAGGVGPRVISGSNGGSSIP